MIEGYQSNYVSYSKPSQQSRQHLDGHLIVSILIVEFGVDIAILVDFGVVLFGIIAFVF